MANKEKSHPPETNGMNLRRSSRSTRGSVKPVIDLTKEENDSEVEDVDSDEVEEEELKANKGKKEASRKGTSKKERIKKEPVKRATGRKSAVRPVKNEYIEGIEEDNNALTDQDADGGTYYELSETELKDINHAFDMNRISDEEELLNADGLRTAIRSLGFEPRCDEIKKLMKSFSKKGNKINRDGFHKLMAIKYGSSPGTKLDNPNDEISRVFNLLDLDKTGLITLDNLKSISKELNEDLTEEELHEMISEADLDGDFKINKQEFQNIMIKTSLY